MNTACHSITIATAGHVDHGKTSLVGRITGIDTDTLADEKARGLSINLGFAYLHLQGNTEDNVPTSTVGFIDVPGHSDFINNALAGIGVADFALLVVAADDGIMPQTREHLSIIDLLGIEGGAVVITKIDKVGLDRQMEVRRQVTELVADSTFAGTPVFPVSSPTGEGVEKLLSHLQSLLEQTARNKQASSDRMARFAVDRSFTVKGIGTVVTGTLMSGEICTGGTLVHSASGSTARIKGLQHDRLVVGQARTGERVAVNISLPHQLVTRGDWLTDERLHLPVHRFDARLSLLSPMTFRPGVEYHLYHGTSHHLVQIRALGDHSSPYHQLYSTDPVFACHGDRFILRDPSCGSTLGGGIVVDVSVPRRGRSSDARLRHLAAMDREDLPALRQLLELASGGVWLEEFARGRNCTANHMEELLGELDREQIAYTKFDTGKAQQQLLLQQRYLDQAEQRILETLAVHHREQADQVGLAEPGLSSLVGFEKSHLLFHAIVEKLVTQQRIKRTGTLLHLPGHQAQLSREEREFLEQVRPILLESGFLPPRTRELAEMLDMKLGALERILARARKAGSLIQVASNRHYLPETIVRLAEFTESLAQDQNEGFTVIQFRDRLEIGRNLCIEILEYFDRIGFTTRQGNSRYLRTSKENLFGKAV